MFLLRSLASDRSRARLRPQEQMSALGGEFNW
jgi:hypothetical protein